MKTLGVLIKRNIKLYFNDKGMFLVSLITPVILLVLYATFLGNVFDSAFHETLNKFGQTVDESLIDGLVGGQLISSILASSCVTIAFCTNLVMIQDKYTGAYHDISIAPVNKTTVSLSYFISALVSTLIVCYVTTILGFIYLAFIGWYLTVADVFLILLDVFILCLFGTGLSSVIHIFLTTQGQASGVGTIVSSLYGFVCGAYMPMSQFSEGLRDVLSFLPGTYGTVLLRQHFLGTGIDKLGFPAEHIEAIRFSFDCDIKLLDHTVSTGGIYGILCGATLFILAAYILIFILKNKSKVKK